MACIAGSIAAAFYGTASAGLLAGVRRRLTAELVDVLDRFARRFATAQSGPL
jgi:hypothetical protein